METSYHTSLISESIQVERSIGYSVVNEVNTAGNQRFNVLIGSVTLLFHAWMIILGSIYVHDCKGQPEIPVYLIVGGISGVFLCAIKVLHHQGTGSRPGCIAINIALWTAALFVFSWYIAGCFWVYQAYSSIQQQEQEEYCNNTLYFLTFSLVTLPIFLSFLLFVYCSCKVCVRELSKLSIWKTISDL